MATLERNNPTTDQRPIWVSIERACALTSLGRTRIYELIAAGTLRATKVGKRRLVSFDSIESIGAESD
jgi:excisionase family DNA binding protein